MTECTVALPWLADRPHRNITTPLDTGRPQVSPTALSFLNRPVVSVDHICRPVHSVHLCTGASHNHWFVKLLLQHLPIKQIVLKIFVRIFYIFCCTDRPELSCLHLSWRHSI